MASSQRSRSPSLFFIPRTSTARSYSFPGLCRPGHESGLRPAHHGIRSRLLEELPCPFRFCPSFRFFLLRPTGIAGPAMPYPPPSSLRHFSRNIFIVSRVLCYLKEECHSDSYGRSLLPLGRGSLHFKYPLLPIWYPLLPVFSAIHLW